MKQILIAIILVSVLAIAGCTSQQQTESRLEDGTIVKPDGTMIKPDGTMVKPDGTVVYPNGTMMKPDDTAMMRNKTAAKYSGAVLAGSSAPVVDFNAADYQAAVQSDKLVVLYFYANWCPICRLEVPQLYAAFNELSTDKVVAFRVNFNDDQTDNDERNLARQFGVPYQHTKVFLKNGAAVLKSSETWDKNRYLLEINKALA